MAISMPAGPAAFRAIKDSLDVALLDDGDDVRRLALCVIAVAGLPLPPKRQIDALAETLSPDIFENPLNVFTQLLHVVTEQPTRPADMSEDVFLYRWMVAIRITFKIMTERFNLPELTHKRHKMRKVRDYRERLAKTMKERLYAAATGLPLPTSAAELKEIHEMDFFFHRAEAEVEGPLLPSDASSDVQQRPPDAAPPLPSDASSDVQRREPGGFVAFSGLGRRLGDDNVMTERAVQKIIPVDKAFLKELFSSEDALEAELLWKTLQEEMKEDMQEKDDDDEDDDEDEPPITVYAKVEGLYLDLGPMKFIHTALGDDVKLELVNRLNNLGMTYEDPEKWVLFRQMEPFKGKWPLADTHEEELHFLVRGVVAPPQETLYVPQDVRGSAESRLARGDIVHTHDGEPYVYDPAAYPYVGDEDEESRLNMLD